MSAYAAQYFVAGLARPKGSPRPVSYRGRRALSIKTEGGEAWEQAIIAKALEHRPAVPLGIAALDCVFVFERPKNRCNRAYPTVRPDHDKLMRAVSDALQRAGTLADDAVIVNGCAYKRYGPTPGVMIWVRALIDDAFWEPTAPPIPLF